MADCVGGAGQVHAGGRTGDRVLLGPERQERALQGQDWERPLGSSGWAVAPRRAFGWGGVTAQAKAHRGEGGLH